MHFQQPLQCVQILGHLETGAARFLAATCGYKIFIIGAQNGDRLSSWPADLESVGSRNGDDSRSSAGGKEDENTEPPGKKRKMSSSSKDKPELGSSEDTKEKGIPRPSWVSIPLLASSRMGDYLVAVTAEDKCLRVFGVDEKGNISQLSERSGLAFVCFYAFNVFCLLITR